MNISLLTAFLFTLLLSATSFAADETAAEKQEGANDGEAFAFYVENDARKIGGPGSDQSYSNGLKASYIYAEDRIPRWAQRPVSHFKWLDDELDKSKVNFGLSLGHQIYTPNNTAIKDLIKDDRPYAGWLYAGFSVSFKEEKIGHFVELDLGVVGPSALGEQVQNNFHELIRNPHAKGWDNSLHDEPTVQLSYQKRYKSFANNNLDIIPFYGAAFGNVQIGTHVGALVRFGVNLPDDFGPSRPSSSTGDSFVSPMINPRSRNSYYLFAGGRGNALARNMFLDGNTFQSSHKVTKYPFTFETEAGVGLQILPFGVVWRFVTRSPEFEQRSFFNSFACINVIYFL